MTSHRLVLTVAAVAATVCAIVVATCAVIVTVTVTGPHGVPVLVETRPTFDKNDLQDGVMDALRAKGLGGGGGVTSLSCPAGMPMAAGTSFDCVFEEGEGTSADRKETVLVTVTDDAGGYDVSLQN